MASPGVSTMHPMLAHLQALRTRRGQRAAPSASCVDELPYNAKQPLSTRDRESP